MAERILVVEDDVALSQMLTTYLERRGFDVWVASRGREALRLAYKSRPALVILDIMMPGMNGWQACERLRELSDVPIIMLTAKAEERDVLKGFQLGADDYVKKPFSLEELYARIRAVLRRVDQGAGATDEVYDDGTLRIDLQRRQVFRDAKVVDLTPTEYRLLDCLVRNKGRVVGHEELLEEVWGVSYTGARDSLALYIRYLREKLESDPGEPHYILNRWGMGYWFAPADRIA